MSMSKHLNRIGLLGAVSLAAVATQAQAGGYAAWEGSAEGMGRANAGEGASQGAGGLWWNPAAVAGGRPQVSLNLHQRFMSSRMTDAGSTITRPIPPAGLTLPVGGRAQVDDAVSDATLPDFSAAFPIFGGLTAGVAVTHPFHLATNVPADSWTRYDTLRNRIDVTSVQGGLAAPVTSWLDIGAAIEAQHMTAYLDTASPNLNPAAADGVQRLNGKGWDYGWTLGAQAHDGPLRVGLSYRSAVKHRLKGRILLSGLQAPLDGANFQAPARAQLSTPWSLTAAARWQASPALTLDAQLVRSGWAKYDKVDVSFANVSGSLVQGYRNSTSAAVGADYALSSEWTVRGGVQYDQTPSPDALRDPGSPDADRWVYAAGATRAVGERAKLNAALSYSRYSRAPFHDPNVFYAGTPAQTTVPLVGAYQAHSLTVSLGLDVGF